MVFFSSKNSETVEGSVGRWERSPIKPSLCILLQLMTSWQGLVEIPKKIRNDRLIKQMILGRYDPAKTCIKCVNLQSLPPITKHTPVMGALVIGGRDYFVCCHVETYHSDDHGIFAEMRWCCHPNQRLITGPCLQEFWQSSQTVRSRS